MTRTKSAVSLTIVLLAGLMAAAFAMGLFNSTASAGNGADPTLMVALRGTDTGFMMDIPTTAGGATQGLCFNVDMVDVKTGKVIGDATDCLADMGAGANGGVILTGTTFFNFPGGHLVSRGRTTVQPLNEMAAGAPFTHITGAIPAAGSNQVLSGTGRFAGAEGTVRLSGAVDLSGFGAAVGDPITFDCLFELNLKDQ